MMQLRKVYESIKRVVKKDIAERSRIEFYDKHEVHLGESTRIGEKCNIGKYTYIGNYSQLDNVTIGRYTSIGDYCVIGPGEHRIRKVATSYRLYKDMLGAEYYDGDGSCRGGGCVIGNDVWIGCNVVIRRGVKIGDGAVIGANSYVNKDVPDYAVAAGSPAKIINTRFSETVKNEILSTRWWEYDIEEARSIVRKLDEKHGN